MDDQGHVSALLFSNDVVDGNESHVVRGNSGDRCAAYV